MEALHAKTLSDLAAARPQTIDDFYAAHGCDWMQALKRRMHIWAHQSTTRRRVRRVFAM